MQIFASNCQTKSPQIAKRFRLKLPNGFASNYQIKSPQIAKKVRKSLRNSKIISNFAPK